LVTLSPDGKRLVSEGAGWGFYPQRESGGDFLPPALASVDFKERTVIAAKDLQEGKRPILWHPDGKHLLVGGPTLTMRLLDGTTVKTYQELKHTANHIVLSPDGKTILVDRRTLLDIEDKQATPVAVEGYPFFSPDSKYLLSIRPASVAYWNIATKK